MPVFPGAVGSFVANGNHARIAPPSKIKTLGLSKNLRLGGEEGLLAAKLEISDKQNRKLIFIRDG